jgi:membrane fusion protein (multidrug efflux system)
LLAVCIAAVTFVAACNSAKPPPAPPPPEVSVIHVQPQQVTLNDEYVAQTQAPDTIEIRAQVSGLLQRQAFIEGSRVKKGALLYVIDPRPFESQLAQAKANLAQAQANLVNARQLRARNERLMAQKAVSQQEYDNAVAQEAATTAQVAAQKALLRDAEINLGYTTIRAPQDGFMSSSLVKPGSLITAQQTLLTTLYSSDPMWVNFSLSEDRVLELQGKLERTADGEIGPAPARIQLADGSEYKFPGKIVFVDAAVDQKTGTLQVRLLVPNPDRVLRPGQFVRVIVPSVQNPQAIRIPQQAVMEVQGLQSVYVVDASGKAQQRQIVAHSRIGQDWVVDKGLAPGDVVVVEGIGKLRPDMPVKTVVAGQPPQQPAQQAPARPANNAAAGTQKQG